MPFPKKILEKRQITVKFSGLSIEDSMEKLQTISICLSASEVPQSLAKFGYNEVKEKRESSITGLPESLGALRK
jgi:hypothetical protein